MTAATIAERIRIAMQPRRYRLPPESQQYARHKSAAGQKSLFNVSKPTAKKPIAKEIAAKIQGRLGELLAGKDTVSPADLTIPLQFLAEQSELRERAKDRARKLTGMNAGTLAQIENSHRDYSTVPGFDEAANAVAMEHPELGLDPDDSDTAAAVWELIREGKQDPPVLHSPDVAKLAADWLKASKSGKKQAKAVDDDDSVPFSMNGSPDRYAERWITIGGSKSDVVDSDPDRYRWITIGGGPKGEDGSRHPKGFPVEIDESGKIIKSRAPGLQGKSVSQVKEHFDEQRGNSKPSGAATDNGHDDDRGAGRSSVRRVEGSVKLKTAHEGIGPESDKSHVSESLHGHLSDEQVHGAALAVKAMKESGGFLLADGTGVGKTRQALAVAKTMAEGGKKVLIVTPKSVSKADFKKGTISGSWANDSKAMGVEVTLNNGDNALEPGRVAMTTYENLIKIKDKIDGNTSIIFDEAHAFKNWQAARSKHGAEMAKAAHSVMYATATPADKVEHIGYLAKAGVFGNIGPKATFEKLGMKQIDQHVGGGQYVKKWVVDGKVGAAGVMERMSALFEQLTREGKMLRREISMEGVNVESKKITLPPEAHEAMKKISEIVGEDDGLAKARMLMEQRRQQEPYKVPYAVQDALEDIKSGHQVVIFASRVNASEVGEGEDAVGSEGTMKLLKDEFAKHGITDVAEIHGGIKDTTAEMGKFQGGSHRVVIATVESGGTGINLDDVTGDKPRSLIMLTAPFSAVENVQAAGRVWRRTTKSYPKVKYLFGDTDVDEWNSALITKKMQTLGATVAGEMGDKEQQSSDFKWGPLNVQKESTKPVASSVQSTSGGKHSATWTKLRSGDWGARIEGKANVGDEVTVKSKDGRTKTTKVKRVAWSGDGVSLVEVYSMPGFADRYSRSLIDRIKDEILKNLKK